VPASFVCDSSGKQLEKVGGMSPQKFIDSLKAAQVTIGKPPITGSMIAKWTKDVIKGDQLTAKGKFGKALKSYQKVAENDDAPAFVRAQGAAKIEGLKATVMAAIEEAAALEPKKAKKALKKIQREVKKDMPDAKTAVDEALANLEG
jgi:hypothetical protein